MLRSKSASHCTVLPETDCRRWSRQGAMSALVHVGQLQRCPVGAAGGPLHGFPNLRIFLLGVTRAK